MSTVTDEQIAEWRAFAGPDDYGHDGAIECAGDYSDGEACDACVSDARVAETVNAILDALEAERARADAAEAACVREVRRADMLANQRDAGNAHIKELAAEIANTEVRFADYLDDREKATESQLTEARVWAEWFAAERDQARIERGQWYRRLREVTKRHAKAKRVIRALWKSRRMWQQAHATEFKRRMRLTRQHLRDASEAAKDLVEAQAWAAWFAAEGQWHVRQADREWEAAADEISVMHCEALNRADAAEAALDRIIHVHQAITTDWSTEGPQLERCRHDGQTWPCDTELARRGKS